MFTPWWIAVLTMAKSEGPPLAGSNPTLITCTKPLGSKGGSARNVCIKRPNTFSAPLVTMPRFSRTKSPSWPFIMRAILVERVFDFHGGRELTRCGHTAARPSARQFSHDRPILITLNSCSPFSSFRSSKME